MKAVILLSLVYVTWARLDYSVPPYGALSGYYSSFTEEERNLLLSTESYVPDTCTPIHVSSNIRHASRYPKHPTTMDLTRLFDRLRGQVMSQEFAAINDTYVDYPFSESMQLHIGGLKESFDIGYRFARNWGSLFQTVRENETIYESSPAERAEETGIYFQIGLSNGMNLNMTQAIGRNEEIVTYDRFCPYWRDRVVRNETAMLDMHMYRDGPELAKLAETITDRLQLTNGTTLDSGKNWNWRRHK